MEREIRKSGIKILGDVRWGSHFCQFYQSREDLIEILVPYFKAGLESNEFCMWITSEPLNEKKAKKAMRIAVPNFDRYLERGQIEIVPQEKWYLKEGGFNLQRVLNAWIDKLNQALAKGYDGIRVTGNTAWLEKKDWRDFAEYEATVNNVIGKHRMIAICSYSLDKCGGSEVIDVVSSHQSALIRREGKWELIESSERKKAEEELRRSREEYVAVTNLTGDIIVKVDKEGRWTFLSDGACEFWGKPREKLLGVEFADYLHPDDAEKTNVAIQEMIKTRKIVRGVTNRQKTPKGWRTIEWNATPIFDEKGNYAGMQATGRDITERKRAEKKIRESEENYRELADSIDDVFFAMDKDLRYTYWNKASEKLTGIAAKDTIGKTIFEIFPDNENTRRAVSMYREVLKTQQSRNFLTQYQLGEKTYFFNISAYPSKNGLSVFVVDVTEQKKTQERIKLFSDAVEGAIDGTVLVDIKGIITYTNPAMEKLFGYKKGELLGKPVAILNVNPEMVEQMTSTLIKTGGWNGEVLGQKKNKETFPLIVSLSTVRDEKGKPIAMMGINRDITERKRAEAIRDVLFNISKAATKTSSLDDLLAMIHEQVGTLMDAKNFYVCLEHDTEKNLYTCPYYKDINPEDLVEPDEIFEIKEGLTHHVLKTKEYLLGNKEELKKIGVIGTVPESWLGVPLKTEDGDVDGVVAVQSYEKEAYSEKDAQVLSIIASNIAGALKYKKAEEELLFKTTLLETQKEASIDGILIVDEKGKAISFNQQFVRLWKVPKKILDTKSDKKMLDFALTQLKSPKQFIDKVMYLYKHKKEKSRDEIELKDGRVLDRYSSPLITSVGKYLGRIWYFRDITERKKAQEEIEAGKKRLETQREAMVDGVVVIDINGNIIQGNKAYAEMHGYNSMKQIIGKNITGFVLKTETPRIGSAMKKCLKKGVYRNFEVTGVTKQGKKLPISVSATVLKDAKGRPTNIIAVLRDITERKRAEKQIRTSLKEKEVLLEEVHHRVKNNMQIISSLLNLQSRHIKDKRAFEIFKSCQNRVKSMALIHERLYQSKEFARVNFAEYIRSLTGHLFSSYGINPEAVKLNINIKDVFLDINPAIPCSLIINELVSNSCKHAFQRGKKGEIKIAMHPLNKDEIDLIVSDNGVGIPEEVDFRNTESLGLHLVNILAEDQLHGDIKLDRTRGTSFHIRFRMKK